MSEVWRTVGGEDANTPRTHALVIGTSHYVHLPDTPDQPVPDDGRVTLGLGQATTPATSALIFATWLDEKYHNPDAPIGTIRLLLSPSVDERGQVDSLAGPDISRSSTTNVKAALRAWKRDCENNRDNVAILYVAGHGIQLTKDDSIVLLEDFADPNENILQCAMDIGSIWRGMNNAKAAKTQFYFVDACRIKPDLFKDYANNPVGVMLDEEDSGTITAAPIFFSAAPRSYALGEPGKGTLFCQALQDCLKSYGVDPPDTNNRWLVTTSSLLKRLPDRVSELARKWGEQQDAVPGGLPVDVAFHVLKHPPDVPLRITLNPAIASAQASARLWDGLSRRTLFENVRFEPDLIREVPGGNYLLAVTFPQNQQNYRELEAASVIAFPPGCEMEIPV
ncbi:MAG: caspase family protein [Candidatus Thiodiazotropha sp. (ex Lucinoma borealis)]|nr:caspase family protein [Candidatus Thiodiazotropha sp. (ex Lucinoma borealis)]